MTQLALDLRAARSRADAGIQQAADATERRHDGWQDLAVEALRQFARKQFEPFTVEAARVQIASALPAPKSLKSWGAVTRRAMADGYLVHTGRYAPAASSNGSPKALYAAGANA